MIIPLINYYLIDWFFSILPAFQKTYNVIYLCVFLCTLLWLFIRGMSFCIYSNHFLYREFSMQNFIRLNFLFGLQQCIWLWLNFFVVTIRKICNFFVCYCYCLFSWVAPHNDMKLTLRMTIGRLKLGCQLWLYCLISLHFVITNSAQKGKLLFILNVCKLFDCVRFPSIY